VSSLGRAGRCFCGLRARGLSLAAGEIEIEVVLVNARRVKQCLAGSAFSPSVPRTARTPSRTSASWRYKGRQYGAKSITLISGGRSLARWEGASQHPRGPKPEPPRASFVPPEPISPAGGGAPRRTTTTRPGAPRATATPRGASALGCAVAHAARRTGAERTPKNSASASPSGDDRAEPYNHSHITRCQFAVALS
jgi:hypothetical protein